MSRTLLGLFLVGALNRPRKRKGTNRENPQDHFPSKMYALGPRSANVKGSKLTEKVKAIENLRWPGDSQRESGRFARIDPDSR